MLLVEGLSSCLTRDVIKRCKDFQIRTVVDFLSVDTEALAQKICVPYKDVAAIQRILLACYSSFAQSGESLYDEQLQSMSILNTGSNRLDEYLDGGIYTGEISEVHGFPGSGKTQLCLSVAATLLSNTESSVIYLDSGGNFSALRFQQILLNKLTDPQLVEDHMKLIRVINVYDIDSLFDVLYFLKDEICKQDDDFFLNLKLLVLDSATPILSPCLGCKQLEGRGLITTVAQQLKLMCSEHSLSVIVCNNVVYGEDSQVKPALGRYWAYVPSVILSMNKKSVSEDSCQRGVSLFKSCRKEALGEVMIRISDCGISDVSSV